MIIESVTVKDGCVLVSFQRSKQGMQFTSREHLKQRIQRAQEDAAELRLMLAIAEHMKSDPELADTRALRGVEV